MTSPNIIPFPGTGEEPPEIPPEGSNAWTRWQVMILRTARRLRPDDKYRAIFNFIWSKELEVGGNFYRTRDHRAYLFDGISRRLREITPKDPSFRAYLAMRYGLLQSEPITRHVVAALEAGTLANGLLREIRRFCAYDPETRVLYVSRYDGTCFRLDGTSVDIVPNGTGAIFADDDGGSNCPDPVVGPHGILFPALVGDVQFAPTTEGGLTPAAQRAALIIWLFAVALPDLLPTKPLLLLEGDKGSGKSTFVQRVQIALHGRKTTLSVGQGDEADFGVVLLRSPVALIDNVDTPLQWLTNALAAYATGGLWVRRKKYTDDSEVRVEPRGLVAITTRNPTTFRRDDVADRCLVMRLERRDEFAAAEQLFARVERDRCAIFGEWLFWLNEIVGELRRGMSDPPSQHRMADFARLGAVIARVMSRTSGRIAGDWSPEALSALFDSMQAERDALVIEGDPIVDLLDRWLDNEANQGREVRAIDLFRELGAIASVSKLGFYRSPKSLGHRLRDLGGSLSAHFQVGRRSSGGLMLYTFRRA